MFGIAFLNALFHISPKLRKRTVHPLLTRWIHISNWPMNIKNVNILQLHQLQCLFQLHYWIVRFMVEYFGGYKKVISFAPFFLNNFFYSFTQCNFIIVVTCCINVTKTYLECLTQDIRKQFLVCNLISSQTYEWEDLFIRKYFKRRSFFLFLFFCHLQVIYFKYTLIDSTQSTINKIYLNRLQTLMIPNQTTSSHMTPLKQTILNRISNKKLQKKLFSTNNNSQIIDQEISINQNFTDCFPQQQLLKYQNHEQPGYLDFINWRQLNQDHFPHVDLHTLTQLFKILRILNYGEVYIPSGLIYDIIKTVSKRQQKLEMQNSIEHFLKINQIEFTVFRQLRKYRSIEEIQRVYKQIPTRVALKDKIGKISNESSNSMNNDKKTKVFDRIYGDSIERRNQLIRTQICTIAKEMKKFNFQPQITVYNHNYKRDSSKCHRICHNQSCKQVVQEVVLKKNQSFIRKYQNIKPINVQDVQICQIPGVEEHITRNKTQQQKIQRLKRQIIKPVILKKNNM